VLTAPAFSGHLDETLSVFLFILLPKGPPLLKGPKNVFYRGPNPLSAALLLSYGRLIWHRWYCWMLSFLCISNFNNRASQFINFELLCAILTFFLPKLFIRLSNIPPHPPWSDSLTILCQEQALQVKKTSSYATLFTPFHKLHWHPHSSRWSVTKCLP